MIVEHLFYNFAIALFATVLFPACRWRTYVGIIVVTGYAPDLDLLLEGPKNINFFSNGFFPSLIHHGYFHNIGVLIVIAIIVAVMLFPFKYKFYYIAPSAGIGFGAHLLEDALVYNPGYAFLWPMSSQEMGIGLFAPYTKNFFGIANTNVLLIGVIMVMFTLLLQRALRYRNESLQRQIKGG